MKSKPMGKMKAGQKVNPFSKKPVVVKGKVAKGAKPLPFGKKK